MYLFLTEKEWESFILWRVKYLFWQENLHSYIICVILSAVAYLLQKNFVSSYTFFWRYYNYFYGTLAVIRSFNDTEYFFDVKIWSHIVPSSVFQNTSIREINFLSKQVCFQRSIDYIDLKQCFYTESCFSKYLFAWSSYFFLITTSW